MSHFHIFLIYSLIFFTSYFLGIYIHYPVNNDLFSFLTPLQHFEIFGKLQGILIIPPQLSSQGLFTYSPYKILSVVFSMIIFFSNKYKVHTKNKLISYIYHICCEQSGIDFLHYSSPSRFYKFIPMTVWSRSSMFDYGSWSESMCQIMLIYHALLVEEKIFLWQRKNADTILIFINTYKKK